MTLPSELEVFIALNSLFGIQKCFYWLLFSLIVKGRIFQLREVIKTSRDFKFRFAGTNRNHNNFSSFFVFEECRLGVTVENMNKQMAVNSFSSLLNLKAVLRNNLFQIRQDTAKTFFQM